MYFANKINTFHIFNDLELEEHIPTNIIPLLEKFNDGFETGKNWKKEDRWTPGGPWVYSGRIETMREQSQAENKAWCIGWRIGNDTQNNGAE